MENCTELPFAVKSCFKNIKISIDLDKTMLDPYSKVPFSSLTDVVSDTRSTAETQQ